MVISALAASGARCLFPPEIYWISLGFLRSERMECFVPIVGEVSGSTESNLADGIRMRLLYFWKPHITARAN